MAHRPRRSLEDLLDLADAALEDDDLELALRRADEALTLAPRCAEALELRAFALAGLGAIDEADEAAAQLVALEPSSPLGLLTEAEILIRCPGDDVERARAGLERIERARAKLRRDDDARLDALALEALAASTLGELERALRCHDALLREGPDDDSVRVERAHTLFELGRVKESEDCFRALTTANPDDADAWFGLGLCAERLSGKATEADEAFDRAHALAPDDFPRPVHLEPEAFDLAVREAMDALPPQARPAMENAVVRVLPVPDDDDVREGVSPTVLGLFRGRPVDERSPVIASDHETVYIFLFQKNLERFASSREELVEEIRVTLLHEVGHLMGLDEDELADRGLD